LSKEGEKTLGEGGAGPGKGTLSGNMPPAEFSGFILSMAQAAMIHLGELPDPVSGVKSRNLPQAGFSIDLIDMLVEKTRGNLTSEEQTLIERVRGDLKLLYVRATKG